MLIYISGPYTKNGNGKTVSQNIEQSAQIASDLWEMGHAVISPHLNTAHFEDRCKATYDQYIAGDLHMVCYCDALVMTPDWETSKGAKIEKDYAESLGIPIYVWPEYPELHPTEVRCPEQAKAFREIVGRMYRTHLEKNADYSPMNILVTGMPGTITRIWDKVARYVNLTGYTVESLGEGNIGEYIFYTMARLFWMSGVFVKMSLVRTGIMKQPKNEPIDDSLMDLSVYGIIGLLLRRGKWGK